MLKTKIAVFVSGGGTNFEALINAQENGKIPHGEIVLMVSSSRTAYALKRAENHGIKSVVCSKKELGSQEKFEEEVFKKSRRKRYSVNCSCGLYVNTLK